MKKILGLDLGVSSIGWAVISEEADKKEILGMGSRIIPLSVDDKNEFSSGNAISKNQKRTAKRSQRKGYDRYQLRRLNLVTALKKRKMMPSDDLMHIEKLSLWETRHKAASEEVSLEELGRVLLHLNQKRGYKSSRSDANLDKKDTEYVAEVKGRHERLKDTGKTIGSYFYEELKKNQFYRIKEQVYPREGYIEEFEKICKTQQTFYPDIITVDFINELRNEIIYYQRKPKSQKSLVSVCDFEGFPVKVKNDQGKERTIFAGPKVAHRSSPLFQVCKLWESINNITLTDRRGDKLYITVEKKLEIFDFLDNHDKLTITELFRILGLRRGEGWYRNQMLDKGIQGNTTKMMIIKSLNGSQSLNKLTGFDLNIQNIQYADKETGEVIRQEAKEISSGFEKQPLYRLWHVIYSITDQEECKVVLMKQFGIEAHIAEKLALLDFTKFGFGNKSSKAIRKILPHLMDGNVYSDACLLAGYNHSGSITKEDNLKRELKERLKILEKNSLRQPIVEKILNQMINQINAIIEKYGRPDEIRVELARELKQSRDERYTTYTSINRRERENKVIAERLVNEYGLRATRNNIIRWRLYHEITNDESKVNAVCVYCGKPFGISSALSGKDVDFEHIIPRSKLFDDSQNNKTLSHRTCNAAKGDMTALDYMKSKSPEAFNDYLERIEALFKGKVISKAKRDKFLTPGDKIPTDFIDRQIRETQYISKKAREILSDVCYNVWSTSGSVTEFLRRTWGWDEVLMNLQLPKYREAGQTEWTEHDTNGQKHKKEIIPGWSKRHDHRHHAIDALTIACTRQAYIQRLNNLSSDIAREEMYRDVQDANPEGFEKKRLLENYFVLNKPFSTYEVEKEAEKILVSFKPGKRVASLGVRKVKVNGRNQVVQTGIIVPRGPLSEESVYGMIRTSERRPIKFLVEHPDLIINHLLRTKINYLINKHEGDIKKTFDSLKNEPIYIDTGKKIPLEYASCFKPEYVIKYPLTGFKAKDIESVIDPVIRQKLIERLTRFEGKEKEAFRNLDADPIWYDESKGIQIRSVRCFTGLSAVEPVKFDENGNPIGFVKPGNNHHIAIYIDKDGKWQEHVCTFWHAVERAKHGIPVVIKDTKKLWNDILENKPEHSQKFLSKLPCDGWVYLMSLQQNEMYLIGFSDNEINAAITTADYSALSRHLYRVQKIGSSDYTFRHHLETELIDNDSAKVARRLIRVRSIQAMEDLNPIKTTISRLGEISILNNG